MDCKQPFSLAYFSLFLAIAFAIFSTPGDLLAGKLSSARKAVRKDDSDDDDDEPKESKPKKSKTLAKARGNVRDNSSHGHSKSHHRHSGNHSHSWFGLSIGPSYTPSPTYVRSYVGESYIDPSCPQPPVYESVVPPAPTSPEFGPAPLRFPQFPYANGSRGGMVSDFFDGPSKPWSARVRLEAGSDFDGLDRRTGAFLLEGQSGWGLDFEWNSYAEDLDLGVGGHDELHIGEFDLLYRLIETEHSQWRVGLGVNWLGDAVGTDAGINFTVKADIYPVKPVVMSAEIDLGTLGDAEMFHGAATVGVMVNRVEIFGGYDYRKIGDAELQGPMIGLRVWF